MSTTTHPRSTTRPLPPRETTSQHIQQRLRTEIVIGILRPGDVMQEREIAAAFGVSRTPVREAFLKLADDGLIEMRPQSGTFVTRLDVKGIMDALFVRAAIETAAIRRATTRLTPKNRDLLTEVVERQAAATGRGDAQAVAELDAEFHRTILQASGVGGAWRVVSEARDRHARLHHLTRSIVGVATRIVVQHRSILAALISGDSDCAAARLGKHIEANANDLDAIATRYPEYFTEASNAG